MASNTDEVLARAKLQRSILSEPGYTRTEMKKKDDESRRWKYMTTEGTEVVNLDEIGRIDSLAIPPAWVDVWISPSSNGHIQATGKDAKGRLQYRYHADWTKARAEEKFAGVTDFATALPTIRKCTQEDMDVGGMPKRKVVALVVVLMDRYHIRVGNDEYARKNKSYGLTTLTEGMMKKDTSKNAEGKYDAIFSFTGKSGKEWNVTIWEDDLAELIFESQAVGGDDADQDLFRYEDEGDKSKHYDIKSNHINEYLDALTPEGQKVTAKEFRTWAATWKAASRLAVEETPETQKERKRTATAVIKTVASDLGNTPAVCRSSYIHPGILSDWNDGKFSERWETASNSKGIANLSREEATTLSYLQERGN